VFASGRQRVTSLASWHLVEKRPLRVSKIAAVNGANPDTELPWVVFEGMTAVAIFDST